MATKYAIYAIKNTLTGQYYVGKSKQPKQRRFQHIYDLKRGKHHSPKLQTAWDTQGGAGFQWKVLQVNIREADGHRWEIFWISALDAYQCGYNMNDGSYNVSPPKPFTWNGVEYGSQSQAAKALGITPNAIRQRLARGYTSEKDMIFPKRRKSPRTVTCTWNGIEYESYAQASRALGITPSAFKQRVECGFTCDEDVQQAIEKNRETHRTPCTWNNVSYPSLTSAAAAIGIPVYAMQYRIAKGYTCDSDLSTKGQPIAIDGKQYESIKAAARELGIGERKAKKLAQRSIGGKS